MYIKIGATIKKAREEKCLSQAELGIELGVTATAINYYEKGKRKISIDDLYRVAAALKKPLGYFLTGIDIPLGHKANRRSEEGPDVFYDLGSLPVLGTVRAGEPAWAEQNIIGSLPFPRKMSEKFSFFLRVKGDSMVGKGICDGDLVLIRRQNYVDYNGQIICALIHGAESTLKVFVKEEGKNEIYLRSANPVYPDIVLNDGSSLKIQGVYAGIFKFPSK